MIPEEARSASAGTAMPYDPHEIVRLKEVGKFLGLGRTQCAAIIKAGLLRTFPLSPNGRARGVTKKSLVEYQRRIMGLSADADGTDERMRVSEPRR
jgi:hypothetical protein